MLQIPDAFRHCQVCLQNDYILRPADLHCQLKGSGIPAVGVIEITHPAKITRRKALNIREVFLQIFCRSNGGTFLSSGTNDLSDTGIHIHLTKGALDSGIQCRIHFAIVNVFTNIHVFLLSDTGASSVQNREKRSCAAFFSILILIRFGRFVPRGEHIYSG